MKLPPTVAKYYPGATPFQPEDRSRESLEIDQIAILVDDLDEAMRHLARAYGWGPFYLAEHEGEAWFRGRTTPCHFRMAFCLVGHLEIELLQHLRGDSAHAEGAPGLFHLRLVTPDMEAEIEAAEARGTRVVWGIRHEERFVGAYLEPDPLGVRTELYGG